MFPPQLSLSTTPNTTNTVSTRAHVFFFFQSPNIMHNAPHLDLRSACSASNVIANGKCTAEQRLQQRSDSPQVKTSSLLFLPTFLFLPLKQPLPQGETHSVAMEFVLRRTQLSTLYRHPGWSADIDDTDQSGLMWVCTACLNMRVVRF